MPIKILAPSAKQVNEAEVLRTAKKLTINELAFLDPDLHKVSNLITSLLTFLTNIQQHFYISNKHCIQDYHCLYKTVTNSFTE